MQGLNNQEQIYRLYIDSIYDTYIHIYIYIYAQLRAVVVRSCSSSS